MSNLIKPYGDTLNDGVLQLSFTLPVENSSRGKKAAELYAAKLNLEQVSVVHARQIAAGFTFFVVYGRAIPTLDYDAVTATEVETAPLDFHEINDLIKSGLQRRLVAIGATIGSDAHTVGIDAIMNMKGYNGHKGLESYHEMRAINLGAQVDSEELVARAIEAQADVILVSQVVTQKNIHLDNLSRLSDILEAEGLREHVILIVGGPRISHELAKELGYDAGFGTGCYAENVASFAIDEWARRHAPHAAHHAAHHDVHKLAP